MAEIFFEKLESNTNYDLFVHAQGANGQTLQIMSHSFKTQEQSFAAVLRFKLKSEESNAKIIQGLSQFLRVT